MQRLIEAEAATQIGAAPHERAAGRTAYRNGYRERTLDTGSGRLELQIPKLRTGSFFSSLLEPRRRIGRALLAVVQEAYVLGTSTRKVGDLMAALGGCSVSRSEVSRICAQLDEELTEFRDRPPRPYRPRRREADNSVRADCPGSRESCGMQLGGLAFASCLTMPRWILSRYTWPGAAGGVDSVG